ncbi:hypothetical protein CGGC5_v008125 [Colletotrichum fructicola Nara gc5]|uniref:Uncharacterized protein n=1 Tax=Colletotrichum fructicola (strain Nara gc5) TaxID=1213859 RepID=A0A7J6J5N1_COLFN|nr:hypothetical protein CGGC5_v008125 [Colletotrichum fructicola Nara gc5]
MDDPRSRLHQPLGTRTLESEDDFGQTIRLDYPILLVGSLSETLHIEPPCAPWQSNDGQPNNNRSSIASPRARKKACATIAVFKHADRPAGRDTGGPLFRNAVFKPKHSSLKT